MNSRRKGHDGEREVARLLWEELGVRVARNLEQTRNGGHDLIVDDDGPAAQSLDRYAMEIKRARQATPGLLMGWWTQACEQAAKSDRLPALIYRQDRHPWRVVLPLSSVNRQLPRENSLEWSATLSLPGFCSVIREL